MPPEKFDVINYLRALLIVGRVSNLPTVWTNCLAGYVLGGGRDWNLLYTLGTAATCLYLGGMFLNDAMDADYDREFRRARPIPQGTITEWKVWCLGFMFLGGGVALVALLGGTAFQCGAGLVGCILFYNAFHKKLLLAPVIMAGCRFFLFLLAAAVGPEGIQGLTVWYAVVLAAYIVGASYLARKEAGGDILIWPCLLLLAPVVLAVIVNDSLFRQQGYVVAAVVALWVLCCLRQALGPGPRSVAGAVSGLLAGITLLDLAAVGPVHPELVLLFPLAFLVALLMQRFVPAT
ncbi:MAG: UbiA family prenyltransferase [Verrucomicrobiota bacterium]